MKFIYHLSAKGTDYLHPGGKACTDFLVGEMLKVNPKRILEIGCGTGSTLVSLASHHISELHGIDVSGNQIGLAKDRIRYCKLTDRVKLSIAEESGELHFDDHSFDIVFAESVLGIITHMQLIKLANEVKRILKPNGLFITNDAIWKYGTSKEAAELINNQVMRDFGLIQSTAQLIGRDEWENFFSHIGLHIQQTIDINKTLQYHKPNYNELELLSKNYSTKLRHRSYLNPIALIKTLWYQLKLHLSHRDDYKHLENIIFIMKA